jgi:hypothetical protein
MKCIDDHTQDDLAKSSSTLQCILSILDYECARFHFQPEVIGVSDNVATVNLDPMDDAEIMHVCIKVNRQFQRLDKKPTCAQQDHGKTFVRCEAVALTEYIRLT